MQRLIIGHSCFTFRPLPALPLNSENRTSILTQGVARKLLEAQTEQDQQATLASAKDSFDYPLILGLLLRH